MRDRRAAAPAAVLVAVLAVLVLAVVAVVTFTGDDGGDTTVAPSSTTLAGDDADPGDPAPAPTTAEDAPDGDDADVADGTTSTDGPDGAIQIPATVPVPSDGFADPTVDDVDDEVFDGLGEPRIDIVHYDLTVRADRHDPQLAGTAVLHLAAVTEDPLDRFTLDLDGPRVGVVVIDGRPAEADQVGDEVTIRPATALRSLEVVRVELTYAGRPSDVRFAPMGARIGWQPDDAGGWFAMSEPDGTSTWAPVSDHPSDKATWRITLDTEADVTGVANGRLVDRREVDGRRHWVWEQDRPMATYLALVAVGRYELVERTGPAGIEVVFAFPRDLAAADRSGFAAFDEILGFFADEFGPYADDDAGAIVVPADLPVALETQTRPLFSRTWVDPDGVEALAHEIAHEWFGNAVTPADWSDLWLSEGFATYADLMWRSHHHGVDLTSLVDDDQSPLFGSSLAPASPEAAAGFDAAVYGGGARALHALRLELGDATFRRIVRRWYADFAGEVATTDDFVALATDEAGRDLGPFLDRWLREGGYHELPR